MRKELAKVALGVGAFWAVVIWLLQGSPVAIGLGLVASAGASLFILAVVYVGARGDRHP